MKTKISMVAVALLAFAGQASAAGPDLAACRFENGTAIAPTVCESLRRSAADSAAKSEQAAQARIQAADQADREKREAAAAEDARRADAAIAARQAQEQELRARAEQWRQEYAASEAEREKRCGKDYGQVRVGMTLQRAAECSGDFSLVHQVQQPDGTLSTFRDGRVFIHVKAGRVVAWSNV